LLFKVKYEKNQLDWIYLFVVIIVFKIDLSIFCIFLRVHFFRFIFLSISLEASSPEHKNLKLGQQIKENKDKLPLFSTHECLTKDDTETASYHLLQNNQVM
jgi:hypothetical protein